MSFITPDGFFMGGHGDSHPDHRKNARLHYRKHQLFEFLDNLREGPFIPPSWSNEDKLSGLPILSQGRVADCATVASVTALYALMPGLGLTPELPSVRYAFYYARLQSYGKIQNSGVWLYNTFQAINSRGEFGFVDGLPTESQVPSGVFSHPNNHDWDEYNQVPAVREGRNLPGVEIIFRSLCRTCEHEARADQNAPGRPPFISELQSIKRAVKRGRLVLFSMEMSRRQWEQTDSQLRQTGVLELPYGTDDLVGGHTMVIVGYDDRGYGGKYGPGQGAFKVRNSWGPDFGDSGHMYLPYGLLEDRPDGVFATWENFVYVSALEPAGTPVRDAIRKRLKSGGRDA